MYYEWGLLDFLQGKQSQAIEKINNIEKKDKANYANAQKLRELINA